MTFKLVSDIFANCLPPPPTCFVGVVVFLNETKISSDYVMNNLSCYGNVDVTQHQCICSCLLKIQNEIEKAIN